jgi:hypothetical protein
MAECLSISYFVSHQFSPGHVAWLKMSVFLSLSASIWGMLLGLKTLFLIISALHILFG